MAAESVPGEGPDLEEQLVVSGSGDVAGELHDATGAVVTETPAPSEVPKVQGYGSCEPSQSHSLTVVSSKQPPEWSDQGDLDSASDFDVRWEDDIRANEESLVKSEGSGSRETLGSQPPATGRRVSYKTWQHMARNHFFCDGSCMLPADFIMFFYTNILIVIATLAFYLFVAKHMHWIVATVTAVAEVWAIGFLHMAAWMDPGFIPRKRNAVPAPNLMIRANGTRFCETCLIWKPESASHCRFCDACVLRMDHHCPYLGTCIGQRNYRYYIMFILSLAFVSFWCCITSVIRLILVSHKIANGKTPNRGGRKLWTDVFAHCCLKNPHILLVIAISAYAFSMMGSLALYHLFLISVGQTTHENLSEKYEIQKNQNDKGCVKNWLRVFWEDTRDSFIVA